MKVGHLSAERYPDTAPDWSEKEALCGSWLEERLQGEGAGLGKDQMLLVQQGSGEAVDWSNGTEWHGVVPPPEQVRTKHHSQVTVGHLIHLTVSWHLNTHKHIL